MKEAGFANYDISESPRKKKKKRLKVMFYVSCRGEEYTR